MRSNRQGDRARFCRFYCGWRKVVRSSCDEETDISLTFTHGPLADDAVDTVNYSIDGPEHRLFFDEFPRRVRGLFGNQVVLDSDNAMLLHETGLLPQLYVPTSDVRADLLTATDHTTRSPFMGDASHWSIRVHDRTAENAVWAYAEPPDSAAWLRGYQAFDFDALDAWFDEDEEIIGHLRDPYHRVDVRASSRHVVVLGGDQAIADTFRPNILSETGLPNRYYIPTEDVRRAVLKPSATHTVCPYKGTASYYAVSVDGRRLSDVAWFYPQPLENAQKVAGHLCYLGDGITLEVDGNRVT